ncbi:DUF6431 domain-containing protein [Anaerobacillus isosaccharinicus]|uniref:DUF6431 domain-containing protein n=2 Tax=Anaerobacillus isosaccharinicus TaxID=1532552 RepID=A0A1S2M339_9BACI|nr:hypothetical protein [Anaerobacillus isosaccharinicus]
MVIIHDFGIGLQEYELRGKENEFPIIEFCSECKGRGKLYRHGFYMRFGIIEKGAISIPICRVKCKHCKTTFSIIPDFLIPHFQHTLHTIVKGVEQRLLKRKAFERRQLVNFHFKRYVSILKWVHTYFSNLGYALSFSDDQKKEAIKYLKMIQDFGESSFLRRSQGHLKKHFMAL